MSGNVSRRAIQPHIALALLFGIVKRMGVQERPHELPADIFQAKFKVRVLVNGVVAGKKRGRADGGALLLGDLFRRDQPWRVAGARRGDCQSYGCANQFRSVTRGTAASTAAGFS